MANAILCTTIAEALITFNYTNYLFSCLPYALVKYNPIGTECTMSGACHSVLLLLLSCGLSAIYFASVPHTCFIGQFIMGNLFNLRPRSMFSLPLSLCARDFRSSICNNSLETNRRGESRYAWTNGHLCENGQRSGAYVHRQPRATWIRNDFLVSR